MCKAGKNGLDSAMWLKPFCGGHFKGWKGGNLHGFWRGLMRINFGGNECQEKEPKF